jgi:tetratricopeptide (TPR) repeat protein
LFELHRYQESLVALSRALELDPTSEKVRYNLALAQIALKNKDAALAQYLFLKNTNSDLAERLYELIYRDLIVKVNDK